MQTWSQLSWVATCSGLLLGCSEVICDAAACAGSGSEPETSGPPPCDAAQQRIIDRMGRVFVAGASNSPGCSDEACDPSTLASDGYYYGLVVARAWERVKDCTAEEPGVTVGTFTVSGDAPSDTSLAMAIDAFYHSTQAPIEEFFGFVEGYLVDLIKAAPAVSFVGATVPEPLIDQSNPASYNGIIVVHVETVGEHTACHGCSGSYVDVDALYRSIDAGKVTYEGTPLALEDVMDDALHLNALGHRVAADAFIARINAMHGLDIEPYGDLVVLP